MPRGSLTVTNHYERAAPGAVTPLWLADAAGKAAAGGADGDHFGVGRRGTAWKLAGLTIRPGVFVMDMTAVWYWVRGRWAANADPVERVVQLRWRPATCCCRWNFLSSPNLEKLRQEQALIMPSPQRRVFVVAARWRPHLEIEAVGFDPTLHEADLGVVYQSTGVTDPAALRTEATAVLSAFLKTQPGIRANFHGSGRMPRRTASARGDGTADGEYPFESRE